MRGKIVKLNESYGFIKGEDGVSRFFIPSSLISPSLEFADLEEGMTVRFVHEDAAKGPRAAEVDVVAVDEETGENASLRRAQ